MEASYDTKEGIAKSIGSLEELAKLLTKRRYGYFWKDEELKEFFILGRYRLDKRGNIDRLTGKIPKEIFPDFPDVMTSEDLIDYIENNPGGITRDDFKYGTFKYESMVIESGLKCPSCGLVWDISNVHEALIYRNCEWISLDNFVGQTLDEVIKKLNEKHDGIYDFGPSDHGDGEVIAQPNQSLLTSIIRLSH
ncbi:MAG: hypothetical protein WCK59_04215 [Candidatus Falkowbacteria bacterium]